MGHLKRSAGGHLIHTASGHLANACEPCDSCTGATPDAVITIAGGGCVAGCTAWFNGTYEGGVLWQFLNPDSCSSIFDLPGDPFVKAGLVVYFCRVDQKAYALIAGFGDFIFVRFGSADGSNEQAEGACDTAPSSPYRDITSDVACVGGALTGTFDLYGVVNPGLPEDCHECTATVTLV